MAVTLYQKTIGVTPNLPQLRDEIDADPTIAPKTVADEGLTFTSPNLLDVWMSDALTTGEETALDAVIAAHTPVTPLDDTNVATYTKAAAPTVNDDVSEGVLVNDQWIDTTTSTLYVCTDNTEGAAVWVVIPFVSSTAPSDVGTTSVGTGDTAARADHVHAHGDQAGGTLHADATNTADGFMPLADKAFANHGFDTGWTEGGTLTYGTGLVVNVAAGDGFYNDAATETTGVSEVNWTADTVTFTAGVQNYVYVTSAGVVTASTTEPDAGSNIVLGSGYANGTAVSALAHSRVEIPEYRDKIREWIDHVFGGAAVEGLITTENGTTPLHLDVSTGEFYISGIEHKVTTAETDITWTYWYSDGSGGWTTVPNATAVNVTNYDDKTGTLATIPTNRWKKDLLFITENGDGFEFHVVYAAATYTSQAAAESAGLPAAPVFLSRYAARISGLVVQQGGTSVTSVIDEKLQQGQAATGTENPTRVLTSWVPVQSSSALQQSSYGRQIIVPCARNGSILITIPIPSEAVSIVSAEVIGIPDSGSSGAGKDIDLYTDYGSVNETPTTHQESDTTTTYTIGTVGSIQALFDISGILTNAVGGDIVGLQVTQNSIGGSIEYLGTRLTYEVLA